MKKSPTKVTLNTLDKKIDTLITTMDGLAISTKKGFDEVKGDVCEFKDEMTDFKKKAELTLFNLDSHARTTNERLDAIEKILGPVVHLPQVMQREFREHDRRISLLEKKVRLIK